MSIYRIVYVPTLYMMRYTGCFLSTTKKLLCTLFLGGAAYLRKTSAIFQVNKYIWGPRSYIEFLLICNFSVFSVYTQEKFRSSNNRSITLLFRERCYIRVPIKLNNKYLCVWITFFFFLTMKYFIKITVKMKYFIKMTCAMLADLYINSVKDIIWKYVHKTKKKLFTDGIDMLTISFVFVGHITPIFAFFNLPYFVDQRITFSI